MQRIMNINFAAIHTSSAVHFYLLKSVPALINVFIQTFTHCLFTLSVHPEWIAPLREEIQGVFDEEGMTKAALQKMIKLDSFFRECNRTNGLVGSMSYISTLDIS
jgi:hypothetical protein